MLLSFGGVTLHDVIDGAKGMRLIMEVLCEVRGAAVMVESTFVFIIAVSLLWTPNKGT